MALQILRDLFLARFHPNIPKRSELMRIAFTRQNGFDDRLPGHSADITQHIRQLHIHLREHLLHPLDVPRCRLHQVIALPPVCPHRADLLRGPERIAQQTVGVQLHQPLALLHVALAAREILRVARIDQVHFQTSLFENVVEDHSELHPLMEPKHRLFSLHILFIR